MESTKRGKDMTKRATKEGLFVLLEGQIMNSEKNAYLRLISPCSYQSVFTSVYSPAVLMKLFKTPLGRAHYSRISNKQVDDIIKK